MSRFGRVVAAMVALLLPLAIGCQKEHACTLLGCLQGLSIYLDGKFDVGTAYSIDVALVTPAGAASIMTCSLAPSDAGGGGQVVCDSQYQHSDFGRVIVINDTTLKKVQVTVSAGGVQLGQQTFPVTYAAVEINGPGCGTCTMAAIHVTTPQ